MSAIGAVSGLRVIELAHYIAGPQCGQILADHGATVVKVEPPGGDRSRLAPPVIGGVSHYFAAHNRSKRSIVVDLKHPDSVVARDALIRWADVLVTNYALDVPEALGFGWGRVHVLNPRLVMVHITGFGSGNSRSSWAAYDGILQAMSGFADMTGDRDGPPVLSGVFAPDHIAGQQAALGVLLALAERARHGEGQLVEVSMLDVMVGLLAHLPSQAVNGEAPRRAGNAVPTAFANTYPAADGWVYLAPLTPPMWTALCEVIGRPDLDADPRYRTPVQRLQARDELEAVITAWTSARPRAGIVEALQSRGVAAGPVTSVAEVAGDADLRGRRTVIDLQLDGAVATVPGAPLKLSHSGSRTPAPHPVPGQHSAEVLAELGFPAGAIEDLVRRGVVHTGSAAPEEAEGKAS